MNGEAVFCHTGQFALRCPRTLHVGSGGIRYILATLSEGCIRKVIQVSAFMKPGTFYVSGQVYHLDIAVDFGKVRLQLGKETSSVSQESQACPFSSIKVVGSMSFHQPRGPLGVISSVTSGFPIASVKGPVGNR